MELFSIRIQRTFQLVSTAYSPLLSVYLPDIRFYRPDLPPFVDTYIYDTANRQEHGDVPRRNLGKKRSRV